jgi:tripartite-type tricarboxylate transporter receptor subunit TctC
MRKSLTTLLSLLLATTMLPAIAQGAAQAWPTKPVRFVNAFPPGGPSDLIARAVADAMQQSLKQTFIVENKPGATGNIGADLVAKSPADGYTVLFTIDASFTVNPHIYVKMPFGPNDLRPAMVIASSGLMIGVNPATKFKTVADLVASARTRSMNFSSGGSGSPGHLAAELFTEVSGVKINHVPYKGNSPAVLAVLANEVDGGVLATPGMLPHVATGKITALAVTSRQRSKLAPQVPTVAEAGLKELELEVLYIAMVPAATPAPVLQALQAAMAEALARSDVQSRLSTLDLHLETLTGEAASKRLSNLSDRYGRIIKATGMKVE